MNAEDLRVLAQRCRQLLRVASVPEVKAQLRDWINDFEAEAEAVERGQPFYRVRELAELDSER